MSTGNSYYNKKYFESKIFDYDYKAVAVAIYETYKPKSVIEFGCGNGELSKHLASFGVTITAIDGFSTPDFEGHEKIKFYKVDLNDPKEISNFLNILDQKFDLAISLEVAEHLNPGISATLVDAMTFSAGTVIFSSAIPEQVGDGHINCQTRTFWNELFEKKDFYLMDTIRKKIRDNKKVARWYQLNISDYCKVPGGPTRDQYVMIVKNLIASESAASSFYYLANRKYELLRHWLQLDVIAAALSFRNFCKRVIGKSNLKEIDG